MENNTAPAFYGVIPARYDSTRLPGKPLADICGRPMIWHVYQRAVSCPVFEKVFVATDDSRIFSVVENYGIDAFMTSKDHPSGSDRVLEAAIKAGVPDDAVVINIQGDEPLLDPGVLMALTEPFKDADVHVTTPACIINSEEAANPNRVKIVLSSTNRALYFSRSLIPYPRSAKKEIYYGHIGLYAFRMNVLKKFVSMDTGRLESIEKLEQLRLLENNIPIDVVVTESESIGVDTHEDLDRVIRIIGDEKAPLGGQPEGGC